MVFHALSLGVHGLVCLSFLICQAGQCSHKFVGEKRDRGEEESVGVYKCHDFSGISLSDPLVLLQPFRLF